jgi:hypothetical protein
MQDKKYRASNIKLKCVWKNITSSKVLLLGWADIHSITITVRRETERATKCSRPGTRMGKHHLVGNVMIASRIQLFFCVGIIHSLLPIFQARSKKKTCQTAAELSLVNITSIACMAGDHNNVH